MDADVRNNVNGVEDSMTRKNQKEKWLVLDQILGHCVSEANINKYLLGIWNMELLIIILEFVRETKTSDMLFYLFYSI